MKFFIIILVTTIVGCNQSKTREPEKRMERIAVPKDTVKHNLDELAFAVKKDLVCGMPVSAGILDTAKYKEKLYGFCSPECKEAFLKDPKEYLTVK